MVLLDHVLTSHINVTSSVTQLLYLHELRPCMSLIYSFVACRYKIDGCYNRVYQWDHFRWLFTSPLETSPFSAIINMYMIVIWLPTSYIATQTTYHVSNLCLTYGWLPTSTFNLTRWCLLLATRLALNSNHFHSMYGRILSIKSIITSDYTVTCILVKDLGYSTIFCSYKNITSSNKPSRDGCYQRA